MLKPILYRLQVEAPQTEDVTAATATAIDTVSELVNGLLRSLPLVGIGVIVFLFFVLLGSLAKRAIRLLTRRNVLDAELSQVLGSLASALITILGVLVAAVIIFPTFSPGNLVAGLGITSVAIGFAFKDVLQNLFAGILILWRRPFRVGDQIRTETHEGTVEGLNVRSTYVKTYAGERVVIPNGEIYTNAVVVKTAFDIRRSSVVVGIGYEDDIDEARGIIHRTLAAIGGVLESPAPWVYVEELAPSSVNFRVYFWGKSTQAEVLRTQDEVLTRIKQALDAKGIEIPFPYQVLLLPEQIRERLQAKSNVPIGSDLKPYARPPEDTH